jgi:hypothetical protein
LLCDCFSQYYLSHFALLLYLPTLLSQRKAWAGQLFYMLRQAATAYAVRHNTVKCLPDALRRDARRSQSFDSSSSGSSGNDDCDCSSSSAAHTDCPHTAAAAGNAAAGDAAAAAVSAATAATAADCDCDDQFDSGRREGDGWGTGSLKRLMLMAEESEQCS